MKTLIKIVILLFAFGLQKTVVAQKIQAFALIDTSKIKIGEQAKVDLFINYSGANKKLNVQWPTIGDTLTKQIEVVNVSAIDTTIPDKNDPNNIQQHQTIYVTSFDSGYWAMPPFQFIVDGDTAHPVLTQALLLEVQTIPVDTAEASIKDIKAVYDEPFSWKEYLPYIYWGTGILAVLVLIYFIIYKIARSKKPIPIVIQKPKIAPHIIALHDLENIRTSKLWQEGKTKEYYTAITDTLRVYIEGRYNIAAMELTSDEIMAIMRSQVIDNLSKDRLRQVLSLADYVKFAKAQPIDVENELTLSNAFDFVKGTLREEITAENSQFNNPEQK